MANESGWHKGDRVYCRANNQHGIVDGWKDGKLLVCWGMQQMHQGYVRSWVSDEDCEWRPSPVEVLDEKDRHIVTKTPGILTPTPLALPEVVRQGGCDTTKYRL